MIHIRVDNEPLNKDQRMACGIVGRLPEGDAYFFSGESGARRSDCPGCNPNGPQPLGIPLSKVTGADLDRIADQWRGLNDHE